MTDVLRAEFVHTGESASLYNCSLSPGFTEAEVQVLRLALMKFGIGKWMDIVNSGCLPGKTPAQLNLQTQRLLGQQSTAEFMGLHIDPDKVRMENSKKQGPDVKRKNGCIVNSGNKMRKEEIIEKTRFNEKMYGVPEDFWMNIELPTPDVKLPFGSEAASTGSGAAVVVEEHTDVETDSEAPYTSDSDTDAEGEEEAGDGENAMDKAALRKKLEADLEKLQELLQRRREVRAMIGELETVRARLEEKEKGESAANEKKLQAKASGSSSSTAKKTDSVSSTKGKENRGKKAGAPDSKPSTSASRKRKTSDAAARSKTASDKTSSGRSAGGVDYNEDEEDSSCLCFRGYAPGDFMLDCDSCHKWFHGECVGVSEDIPDDFTWLCAECCP